MRGNVHGALDLGLAPGLLPGRVALDAGRTAFAEAWGGVPAAGQVHPGHAGRRRRQVAAVDPAGRRSDQRQRVEAPPWPSWALGEPPSSPSTRSRTTRWPAKMVLPAAGYGEVDGTTTNLEGRICPCARRSHRGTARPTGPSPSSSPPGSRPTSGFEDVAGIWAEIEAVSAAHEGITAEALCTMRDGMVAARHRSGEQAPGGDARTCRRSRPSRSRSIPPSCASWCGAPCTTTPR
ncbi:MAG: hypothetical protein R2749_02365 [Acidimicrobiales bacterium]